MRRQLHEIEMRRATVNEVVDDDTWDPWRTVPDYCWFLGPGDWLLRKLKKLEKSFDGARGAGAPAGASAALVSTCPSLRGQET